MAKLHFKYGAMNSGKTTMLIQTAHNYEERNQKVIVIKASVDTKGSDTIVNRIGLSRKVDELIKPDDKVITKVKKYLNDINCLIVDEVQFFSRSQIDELFYIAKVFDIPVITYGLRNNFKSVAFTGSSRLLEIADSMEEIPTICDCGKKARFNVRNLNGKYLSEGDDVLIDGTSDIVYISLCGQCYCKKVLGLNKDSLLTK